MVRRQRPTKATDLSQLKQQRGQSDLPTYVELSDNLTVGVRLCNMESMIALGILPEPLMEAAIGMGKKSQTERTVADFMESAALQDVMCAAIIVDPPWAMLQEVKDNNNICPEGKIWLGMLTDEEIGACFHLVYKGLDSWEAFREELPSGDSAQNGNGVGDETERSNLLRIVDSIEARSDDASNAPSEVDVRQSGVLHSDEVGVGPATEGA